MSRYDSNPNLSTSLLKISAPKLLEGSPGRRFCLPRICASMPARMDIEAQILARQKRLPGLPSSNFGAEILTNDVDRFGFESYLDNPADREDAPRRDLHAAMELKLGMDKTPGYGPGAKR